MASYTRVLASGGGASGQAIAVTSTDSGAPDEVHAYDSGATSAIDRIQLFANNPGASNLDLYIIHDDGDEVVETVTILAKSKVSLGVYQGSNGTTINAYLSAAGTIVITSAGTRETP